jgi:hypothetical protein
MGLAARADCARSGWASGDPDVFASSHAILTKRKLRNGVILKDLIEVAVLVDGFLGLEGHLRS